MNELTQRFLSEISDQVGYDRVVEVHLFSPIRQGGQESGVAVVAALPEVTEPVDAEAETEEATEVETEVETEAEAEEETPVVRHVVYTARYRSVLKGPDRGKWDFDIKAEADAPLITVDEVVRGVGLRSGDAGMPEHISRDEFRATVPAPEGFESEPASPPHPDTPQPDMLPA